MHGFDVLADPVRRRTIELIAQSERARGGQQRGAVTEAARTSRRTRTPVPPHNHHK